MNPSRRSRALHSTALVGAITLALTLALPLSAGAASKETPKPATKGVGALATSLGREADPVVATVAGRPITESEVRALKAVDYHNLIEQGTHELVQERLLAAEAAARGVGVEKLLAEAAKGAPVTDQDVDAFYEQNRKQIPPTMTKEQVAPRIRQYLEQQRQAEAVGGFLKSLEAKYQAKIELQPLRIEVAAQGPARGPATAPVTIVEFSDFQCPACLQMVPTVEQVRAQHPDQVRVVYRQFPLNIHPNAPKAAEASLCADEQGKFWAMHDAMFKDQSALAVDRLKATAAELGLDAASFNSCLDSGRQAAKVEADFQAGRKAGVGSTPTLFVNGRMLVGPPPAALAAVVEEELARASR